MTHTLFDSQSWLSVNVEDYVDEYLDCSDQSREDFSSEEALHEAVYDWLSDNTRWEWEDFLDNAKKVNGPCVVTGYFMSWMGPQEGGKVYPSLADAISNVIMDDSHAVFTIDENGLIVLSETHHDAPCSGNHWEFRVLSAAGKKYYNRHKDSNRRTLCETLVKEGNTRRIPLKAFYLSKADFKERATN